MRALGRWVLVLLLVLGVPLKALAVSGGTACLHGHGGDAGHGSAHAADAATDAATDGAAHEPCHGHQGSDEDGTPPHACSACAPCSAAAAPAPEPAGIGIAEWPPAFEPQSAPLARGVVADVPHRPPR